MKKNTIIIMGLLSLVGCTTPTQVNKPSAKDGADTIAKTKAGLKDAKGALKWGQSSHVPGALSFSSTHMLQLGYGDGVVAFFDHATKKSTVHQLTKGQPVVSISPNNDMAMMGSAPPILLRIKDQKQILRMNHIKKAQDGRFSPTGLGFFVGTPDGTLHIWKNGNALISLPDEKVQQFMNRQLADVSARIWSTLQGKLAINAGPTLAIAGKDGEVAFWNPQKPKELLPMFKLTQKLDDLAVTKTHVLATDDQNKLFVANVSKQALEMWSIKAPKTHAVATSSKADIGAFMHDNAVMVRQLEDGKVLHTIAIPKGKSCGLAFSQDATRLAMCVSGVIAVTELGKKASTVVWREGAVLKSKVIP